METENPMEVEAQVVQDAPAVENTITEWQPDKGLIQVKSTDGT